MSNDFENILTRRILAQAVCDHESTLSTSDYDVVVSGFEVSNVDLSSLQFIPVIVSKAETGEC